MTARLRAAVSRYLLDCERAVQALKSHRIGQIVETRRELDVYRPMADQSETAAAKVDDYGTTLAKLGDVTDEDLAAWKAQMEQAENKLKLMRSVQRWLR